MQLEGGGSVCDVDENSDGSKGEFNGSRAILSEIFDWFYHML